MKSPTLEEMLQAGAHFGHKVSRWHPKMKPFIFTERNGVHIIDLQQTQKQVADVSEAVRKMAAEGKVILFVSTKPQAREIVKQAALDCGMPYLVDRWIGGALTNFPEIKRLIKKYVDLKTKRENGELEQYTKKERLEISRKLDKMSKYLEGLSTLQRMPDAIFFPSVQKEKTAMVESERVGMTVVGVCDTNANPEKVQHPICANDDAVKSITMMVNTIAAAIKEGRAEWEKKEKAEKKVGVVEKKVVVPKGEEKE